MLTTSRTEMPRDGATGVAGVGGVGGVALEAAPNGMPHFGQDFASPSCEAPHC